MNKEIKNQTYISGISTLYKSSIFVVDFVERMDKALSEVSENYEIILVDDGSPDNSLELAVGLQDRFKKLRIIQLSRNFGHHAAILAAMEHTNGEYVFLVDSDLEDAPELVIKFHEIVNKRDADVVYGYHDRKTESVVRKYTGLLFWKVIHLISDYPIEQNIAFVRLMKRSYVDALLQMPDQNIFLGGMFTWPGFKQQGIKITRTKRPNKSTYSWGKRIQLAARAIISFSDKPLLIMFTLGTLFSFTAFLIGTYFLLLKLLYPDYLVSGFTAIFISIWFLGGLILGALGIIGFYIAHIYNQTRARPRYLIKNQFKDKR